MKVFNIIFCILFLTAAVLQYNDADPYIWIPIYLYPAILCGLFAREKYYPIAYLSGMIIFLAYAAHFFFTENGVLDWIMVHDAENIAETMKAEKPWIEDTREFFGLLIIVGVLWIDWVVAKKRQKTAVPN